MKINLLYFFKNVILKDVDISYFFVDDEYDEEEFTPTIFNYLLNKYEDELAEEVRIFAKMPTYVIDIINNEDDEIIGFDFSTERCFLSINIEDEEVDFIYKRKDDSFIYNTYSLDDSVLIEEREIDKEFLENQEWQISNCKELKEKIDVLNLNYNKNLIWYDKHDFFEIINSDGIVIFQKDRNENVLDFVRYEDLEYYDLDPMYCFEKAKVQFAENKKNVQKMKRLEINGIGKD